MSGMACRWFLKIHLERGKVFQMNGKGDSARQDRAVLVSSSRLVYQCQPPVEGMLDAESEEAARIAFQEESPFSAESIGLGLVRDRNGLIGIYGCERATLPETDENHFLLPDFFPFLGWERDPGAVELADGGSGYALMFFEDGGMVPSDLVGFDPDDNGHPPEAEIRDTFAYLGIPWPGLEGIPLYRLTEATVDSRGRFSAQVESPDGSARSWDSDPLWLWKADLRDEGELQRLRADQKMGERVWRTGLLAACALGLLAVFQVLLWGFSFWADAREDAIASRAKEVTLVQERGALAQRLGDLGKSRLSVFQKLGELNLLRPEGVQFVEVEFREPDQFRVEGRVPAVRVFNAYMDRLEGDPRFSIGEGQTPRSRDGRVEFELNVRVGENTYTGVDQATVLKSADGGTGA